MPRFPSVAAADTQSACHLQGVYTYALRMPVMACISNGLRVKQESSLFMHIHLAHL